MSFLSGTSKQLANAGRGRTVDPGTMAAAGNEDKDHALAILKKKAAPNKLIVDDATNDDNSVCTLSTATMEKLELFRGYVLLLLCL